MSENKNAIEDTAKTNRILIRYFIVVLALFPIVIGIIFLIFKTAFTEKEEWAEAAKNQKKPSQLINPTRGKIYSSDGKLMVTSAPRYQLYMDFKAGSFMKDTFLHSKDNGVDSLAFYLSRKLKDRSAAGYKTHLMRGMNAGYRYYRIYSGEISYAYLLEIKQFPFFRYDNPNKTGFQTEEKIQRLKLFGTLASRTLGDITLARDSLGNEGYRGYHGLEMQYDALLQGQAGLYSVVRIGRENTRVTEIEPVNGYDIQTTIDIQIQDFTEKALLDKLKEVDAELGIAIIMEVRTGEIKAISNMARTQPGRYTETMNHAVADMIEPGSTFKIASMMVALEDNVCTPDDMVETGNGVYTYGGIPIRDHNVDRGGYGRISVAEAIWFSSNVGVAKTILKGYEDNPAKFVEGLNRIGINAELKLEIPGAGRAIIKSPDDLNRWTRTSLPWMSFGYEVQIPPIQTLTFYNAIANDGKMVHPIFIKEIQKDGKTVKRFTTETLRQSICSRETLGIIREMMVNVVEKGTGLSFRSDAVPFAGKTGTAQIATSRGYESASHNLSFCGYFPADRPQYTCIVVIRRPRNVAPTGAIPGSVFKTIAEKVYSHGTKYELRTMTGDSARVVIPAVKNGDTKALKYVLDELKIRNNTRQIKTEYARNEHNPGNGQIEMQELTVQEGLVPNVVGMGAKDAVYALETSGLRVSFSGRGRVVSQSVSPGQRAVRGQSVALVLR